MSLHRRGYHALSLPVQDTKLRGEEIREGRTDEEEERTGEELIRWEGVCPDFSTFTNSFVILFSKWEELCQK